MQPIDLYMLMDISKVPQSGEHVNLLQYTQTRKQTIFLQKCKTAAIFNQVTDWFVNNSKKSEHERKPFKIKRITTFEEALSVGNDSLEKL